MKKLHFILSLFLLIPGMVTQAKSKLLWSEANTLTSIESFQGSRTFEKKVQMGIPDFIKKESGETKMFCAHRTSTVANYFGIEFQKEIAPLEITVETGGEVSIKNLISVPTFDIYVKGSVTNEGISVLFPQKITMEDGTEYYVNVAYLTEVENEYGEMNSTYVNVKEDGPSEILFSLDENGIYEMKLNASDSGDTEEYPQYIIGIMEDTLPNSISWTGAGISQLQFEEFKETVVTMPDNATVESWAYITSDNQNGFCPVGFEDDAVYISGLCSSLPDACLKGVIEGGKITISLPQYAGINENNQFVYYYGAEQGDTECVPVSQIEMAYDSEGKRMSVENENLSVYLAARPVDDVEPVIDKFQQYPGLDIFYQTEEDVNQKPANPIIQNYSVYDSYLVGGTFDILMPPYNVNGYLLSGEDMYYNIYINDELYTFDPSIYTGFEKAMTDIPYTFKDNNNIYAAETLRQLYIKDIVIDKFGVQLHFKGSDGKIYSSDIVSVVTSSSSIEEVNAEEGIVEYYNLQGIRVMKPEKGLYIRRVTTSENKIETSKIFNH